MNKILLMIGAVLLAAVLSAGGFYAGMQYQVSQADQVQANFLQARGQGDGQFPGQAPGGLQGQFPTDRQGGGMMGFGGGVSGEVKSLEGNILTLSTAENVTTVTLSDGTRVLKTVDGAASDLQPGLRVLVSGERDSAGNLLATQVQVLTGDPILRTAP